MRLRGLLVLALVGGCAHEAAHAHHRFDDADLWAASFEDPSRDAWQKPDEVIAALQLAPDAKVADLGSATGYFSVRLAKALPKGHVYGVDIEAAMVKYLAERAQKEGLDQLTSVLGTPTDAKLPEPVDLVLIVDTYHHIEARSAYFKRLAASLSPQGRIAIIDFTRDSKMGPPASEKVPPEDIDVELSDTGLVRVQRFDFLKEQFFLVYARR